MYCQKCQAPIQTGMAFCPSCGASVSYPLISSDPYAQPSQPVPPAQQPVAAYVVPPQVAVPVYAIPQSPQSNAKGCRIALITCLSIFLVVAAIVGGSIYWGVYYFTTGRFQQIYSQGTTNPPAWSYPLSSASNSLWSEAKNTSGVCSYQNSAYRVMVSTNAPNDSFACIEGAQAYGELALTFQVQVQIRQGQSGGVVLSGCDANDPEVLIELSRQGAYSKLGNFTIATGDLLSPVDNPNSQYTSFDSSKLYTVFVHDSSSIHTGLGETNTLTIIFQNKQTYFYINQQYIIENTLFPDNLSQCKLGFAAFSHSAVAFSHLQIWGVLAPPTPTSVI